jgi:hypothetical protein
VRDKEAAAWPMYAVVAAAVVAAVAVPALAVLLRARTLAKVRNLRWVTQRGSQGDVERLAG